MYRPEIIWDDAGSLFETRGGACGLAILLAALPTAIIRPAPSSCAADTVHALNSCAYARDKQTALGSAVWWARDQRRIMSCYRATLANPRPAPDLLQGIAWSSNHSSSVLMLYRQAKIGKPDMAPESSSVSCVWTYVDESCPVLLALSRTAGGI